MTKPNPTLAAQQRSYSWKVIGCGAAVCLGLSAASYMVGVQPAVAMLSQRQAEEQELRDRQQKAQRTVAELLTSRRRLAAAKKELGALPLRLEPASAVNRRLNLLAGVAADAGITIDELQPQPPVSGPHYQTVAIRVVGTGTYPACAAFLHAMRERFPDTAVRSFDAQNTAPAREGNTATLRMELSWHTSLPAK